MLCGNFSESREKRLKLEDVDGSAFMKALDVCRGRKDCREVALGELPLLASVADRFQMTEVTSVLEEALMGKLNVDMGTCWRGADGVGCNSWRQTPWRWR
uniref:BTB domain-containing protein n=1 Tax=Cryptomonas curvata TaxID=233186 RepID=A0A7S0QU85_9CRYP|mmetsp:Transcript_56187/g.117525  ORF Transcript_56187/g.117525 Transcript_56187/m.117525 type:complete len:100 (+) Transcript_56187:209-508(+)